MKNLITKTILLLLTLGLLPSPPANAASLEDTLSGRILLQVEDAGQAWYVEPGTKERAFLGRPADAFQIMRDLGLGISESDYSNFKDKAPERLNGKILLRVEASGEAYYVNPLDSKLYFLNRPADAFQIMRDLGLGITNADLEQITINSKYQEQIKNQEMNEGPTSNKAEGDKENKETEITNESNDTETQEIATSTDDNEDDNTIADEQTASSTNDLSTEKISTSTVCTYTAEYYSNEGLRGGPILTRTEYGINNDWGTNAPYGLENWDKFSIRWTGNCYFEGGDYKFNTTFNDAIRAYIDDSWIFLSWRDSNVTRTLEETVSIDEGYHEIKVEYYDYKFDAVAKFDWEKIE